MINNLEQTLFFPVWSIQFCGQSSSFQGDLVSMKYVYAFRSALTLADDQAENRCKCSTQSAPAVQPPAIIVVARVCIEQLAASSHMLLLFRDVEHGEVSPRFTRKLRSTCYSEIVALIELLQASGFGLGAPSTT